MSEPSGGVGSWLVDLIMKPGTSVQLVSKARVFRSIYVPLSLLVRFVTPAAPAEHKANGHTNGRGIIFLRPKGF